MTETAHAIDVGAETFVSEVVERSQQVPVLVDFWAEWCGPCKSLMPLLTRLAAEYNGAFLLAKVNIDEEQALAGQAGIRSVPTVQVWRHGKIVDQFTGAQPEGAVREVIERHLERVSDKLATAAAEARAAGQPDEAARLLRDGLAMEPDNHRLSLALAALLVEQGDHAGARDILEKLPLSVQTEEEAKRLLSALEFGEMAGGESNLADLQARIAADPDDLEARHRLSALLVQQGDHEGAMAQLLEILQRDRQWNDQAGRKGLLKLFDLLGNSGELVSRYRAAMARALF